jgi:hypothetical protein
MTAERRTELQALVEELRRQAREHTPNGNKTKFETLVAADGGARLGAWNDADVRAGETLELGLPCASRETFGFRKREQLRMALALQRSVEDSRVKVAMLEQQLAQTILDLERRRRAAENPAMPRERGMHLAVEGYLTAVCHIHKLKCVVSGVTAADGATGSVMSKVDLVEAGNAVDDESARFIGPFLSGKGDRQNVPIPTAILYSTPLQEELRSRGHTHSATLLELLARCFQAWDVSGLDAHARAWSNERMRRVLMVMVGPGVHTAHVNHTTRAGRVGGMTLPLVCALDQEYRDVAAAAGRLPGVDPVSEGARPYARRRRALLQLPNVVVHGARDGPDLAARARQVRPPAVAERNVRRAARLLHARGPQHEDVRKRGGWEPESKRGVE